MQQTESESKVRAYEHYELQTFYPCGFWWIPDTRSTFSLYATHYVPYVLYVQRTDSVPSTEHSRVRTILVVDEIGELVQHKIQGVTELPIFSLSHISFFINHFALLHFIIIIHHHTASRNGNVARSKAPVTVAYGRTGVYPRSIRRRAPTTLIKFINWECGRRTILGSGTIHGRDACRVGYRYDADR